MTYFVDYYSSLFFSKSSFFEASKFSWATSFSTATFIIEVLAKRFLKIFHNAYNNELIRVSVAVVFAQCAYNASKLVVIPL